MQKVHNIHLDQTKEELLNSAKKNYNQLMITNKNRPYWVHKEIPALEKIELEPLTGNWEYTYRLALSKDKKTDKLEIIKQQIEWNKELEIYESPKEEIVQVVDL